MATGLSRQSSPQPIQADWGPIETRLTCAEDFRGAPCHDIFTYMKKSNRLPTTSSVHEHGGCTAQADAGTLDRARGALDEGAALELAETFRLLSDPGRLRLIAALLEAEELCVCDLSEVTGLSATACSHNLRLLRGQRLVRYRRQGRNVFYTLDDDHIRVLLAVVRDHAAER